MKQSNQKQTAARGIHRWLKAGSRTLPMLGTAMLFGMATPALADTRVSFHVGHADARSEHVVERKLNRVARKIARDLNALQPVSHRDRGYRHRHHRDRDYWQRGHRHDRHDRYNDRYTRHDRRYRDYRPHRRGYYADHRRADPLYQPMSFRRWSRNQWRLTHDERHITQRGYQRYLKKYRKHYRHGHKPRYYAGVEGHGRGHRRNRH